MATNGTTTTTTTTSIDGLDTLVADAARTSLNQQSSSWAGVEWFLDFIRTKVKTFFTEVLKKLPIVGVWAARIGTTVTEFIFTVLGTFMNFMKLVIKSPQVMSLAHEAAMIAWKANNDNGLLAQTYAYGKKMAGYFLEIMKQCFERAIKANGLALETREKEEISGFLDNILPKN